MHSSNPCAEFNDNNQHQHSSALCIQMLHWLHFTVEIPVLISAQQNFPLDTAPVQKDLPDVFRAAFNKTPKIKEEGSQSLLLLPIIASNPATGFILGVGGQYAFKIKGSESYSSISGSTQFTSKGQKLFMIKNLMYTKDNLFYLSGDWRFMIFSQPTYGLGTDAPEGGILDYQYALSGLSTANDSLSQPMKFNFARIHQSVSYQILENVYAGLGYHFDSYSKIEDEKLSLVPGDILITSHYYYNQHYGFSTRNYFSSALNINVLYDSRDNVINAQKGIYAMVGWIGGLKILGNKTNTSLVQVEWRSFHKLSKQDPRHILGFWLMGDFAREGDLPYMILPATAYDQRGRSARGYVMGRFRGNQFLYGETEYRFPISKKGGILGGVLFLNATTTNSTAKSLHLFESIKPGYGAGLRILVDKRSRTNLAIDIGFGNKSGGFYLAASETF